jgi:hypothetical protein
VIALVRLVLLSLAAAFAGLIVWAFIHASFWASFAAITADPWGIVTLADLYLGFVLISVVIVAVERSWRALPWVLVLFVLGNIVSAIWVAHRLPRLIRTGKRLRRARDRMPASPS